MNKGRTVSIFIVCSLLASMAILLLYALSVGPACWLMERDYLGADTYAWIYTPLFFVAERFEPLAHFLIYWIDVWSPFDANLK